MPPTLSALVPALSVMLGGLITYLVNVKERRRSKVEEIFHDAIAAVAVARTSHNWIGQLGPWLGATKEEHAELNSQLGREGNLNYARAIAAARAAVARASVYDPSLLEFIDAESTHSEVIFQRADEITARLRSNIEK